jgi:hypothetical protein
MPVGLRRSGVSRLASWRVTLVLGTKVGESPVEDSRIGAGLDGCHEVAGGLVDLDMPVIQAARPALGARERR